MSRLSPVYIIQCPGHSHSHLPQVPSVGPNDSLLLDSVVQIHSVCSSKFTTEYMTMIIYFTKRPEFPGSLQHELPSGHTGIQRSKTFFHLERMERTITLKKEPRSNVQRLWLLINRDRRTGSVSYIKPWSFHRTQMLNFGEFIRQSYIKNATSANPKRSRNWRWVCTYRASLLSSVLKDLASYVPTLFCVWYVWLVFAGYYICWKRILDSIYTVGEALLRPAFYLGNWRRWHGQAEGTVALQCVNVLPSDRELNQLQLIESIVGVGSTSAVTGKSTLLR